MILIILPVKNEGGTIKKTAGDLLNWCGRNLKDYQVLFINDASQDDTVNKIHQIHNDRVRVLNNKFDRGKGSTLKAGFLMSDLIYRMTGDDLIIFMDGDGQIDPQDINTFMNLMSLYNADVVIGNKGHAYSQAKRHPLRKAISRAYNLFVRFLFSVSYHDTQCGIKIFKKYALDKVIHKVTAKKYAFDIELLVAIREMGLRIADSPVNIRTQTNVGSVSFQSVLDTFLDTISIWFRMKKGCYR